MKWLAPYFDFSTMAPAEMYLARHVEYLRGDAKLAAIFGGAKNIRMVPFGKSYETGMVPALYATLPQFDRQPGPGVFSEKVLVRDVIRFHVDSVAGDEPLWEPGLFTLASHIVGVVSGRPASQLVYTTVGSGDIPLATRVDLSAISVVAIGSPQSGAGVNLYDLQLDFEYTGIVKNLNGGLSPRLWPLVTVDE